MKNKDIKELLITVALLFVLYTVGYLEGRAYEEDLGWMVNSSHSTTPLL